MTFSKFNALDVHIQSSALSFARIIFFMIEYLFTPVVRVTVTGKYTLAIVPFNFSNLHHMIFVMHFLLNGVAHLFLSCSFYFVHPIN